MARSPLVSFGVASSECSFLLFGVALLVFSVGFYVNMNHDTGSMSQIGDDWDLVPITDIQIADASKGCPSEYIDLFTREWPGTSIGCDCRGIYSLKINFSQQNTISSGQCSVNATRAGCSTIWSLNPINIRNLGGFQICGKQAGDSFVNTQRPDSTGACPDDHVVCNPAASRDYRTCRKNFTDCPINDMKIVSSKSNDSTYEYRQINSTMWLAFTYKGTGLAVNEFMLSEGQPCMDPTQYSSTNGKQIDYKLEKAISEGCEKDRFTGKSTDPRYKQIPGFSISEYDLYNLNGIASNLKTLPGYQASYLDKKKNNFYQVYVRPVIFWNLTCELREESPISRFEAQDIYQNIGVSMTVPILLVVTGSIFAFVVLVTVINNLYTLLIKNHLDSAYQTSIVRLAFALIAAVCNVLLFMNGNAQALEEKQNAENLASMASCSDADTQFASSDLSSVYNTAIIYAQYGYYVSIAFSVFVGLHIIFVGFWGAIRGRKDYVSQYDED